MTSKRMRERTKSGGMTLNAAPSPRKELQEGLALYILDTLNYINGVRQFCDKLSKWKLQRERELEMMADIKKRADSITLTYDHVRKSEDTSKALGEYIKSILTQVTADSRREELEKELACVLEDTLEGLEELSHFLDAVEKLAVSSVHVFMDNSQVLWLPEGKRFDSVQAVITAAKMACPLLIQFKRDAAAFFIPSLHNVEVLAFQLEKYIRITQEICEKMEKSTIDGSWMKDINTTMILDPDATKDAIQHMLSHIKQLIDIRIDELFRLAFLFQEESGSGFVREFSKQGPSMFQFLADLEESAVQLDRMKKGAKISSVAGSSVGAVGGVLTIIGLALAPVTVGASLALTMTGVGLGITSGVNGAVTTATEIGVNNTHQKKANDTFQRFIEKVEILQECLEEASHKNVSHLEKNLDVARVGKVITNVGGIGTNIVKMLNSEELITGAGKVALQEGSAVRNLPRVASEIPDLGQAAAKGPLALSKTARGGAIAFSALFLGLDLFFICKDSISLIKGSESEVSKFIRARAALWRSELDSWQTIHDSLLQRLGGLEESKSILEMPFYPVREKHIQDEKKVQPKPIEKKQKEQKQRCIIQ